MKKKIAALLAVLTIGLLAACSSASDVANANLSKQADNFEVTRQIVFHNDITDSYIFEIVGLCSLGNGDSDNKRTVVCKVGPDKYVKEIFQMGDNVSVTAIQVEPTSTDIYHYDVYFRPSTVVPNIKTS